jgi:hypothetical protein
MAPQVPISLDERAAIEVALYAALSGRDTHINWAMFDSERWQRLGRLARTWQVAPLLHHAWRNQGPPNLPDALRDQLHQSYRRTAVEALVQQRELNERLLPAFAAAQIPVLLLKGAALAHTLYPAPGLRPMVDLDLLTRRASVDAAAEQLLQLGYTERVKPWDGAESSHHRLFIGPQPQPVVVELHWSIVGAPSDWFAPPMEWFWERCETLQISDGNGHLREGLSLDPTAMLLHLAAHIALQHGIARAKLLWFYDLHLLLDRQGERIDWDLVWAQARTWEWDTALYTALTATRARFGTPLPDLEVPRRSGRGADLVQARGSSLSLNRMVGDFLRLRSKTLAQRVQLSWRLLFPDPDYMRYRYKPNPAWIWPLMYPMRWWRGIVGLGDALLSRSRPHTF